MRANADYLIICQEIYNCLLKEDREGSLSHLCFQQTVAEDPGHFALCYSAANFHPDLPQKMMTKA